MGFKILKQCSRCNKILDRSNFYEHRTKDGLRSECKSCCNKIAWAGKKRRRQQEDINVGIPQEVIKNNLISLIKKCKDCNTFKSLSEFPKRATSKDKKDSYCKDCHKIKSARRSKWVSERRFKLKLIVYEAYGGAKCNCCGETTIEFLDLDHVNNDGYMLRRGRKGSSYSVYDLRARIIKENFPLGFQVLCRNCNWGKHINKGLCPHKERAG